MKRSHLFKTFLLTLYVLGIIFCSLVAILIASGYRYNFSTDRLYKVSIVHIVCNPIAEFMINGQETDYKTPSAVYLEPGVYNIILKKNGYQDVTINVSLGSGSLFELKDILMFKSEIVPEVIANQNPVWSDLADESLADGSSNLFIAFDHEIWAHRKLVTRLSSPIKSAAFYTSESYIIYQTDSFVGVIRSDGSNNQKLFDYKSQYPLRFNFKNRGEILVASDVKNSITAQVTDLSNISSVLQNATRVY